MYYQIEGRLNMKTLTFDEEGLTVGKQTYPIDAGISRLPSLAPRSTSSEGPSMTLNTSR